MNNKSLPKFLNLQQLYAIAASLGKTEGLGVPDVVREAKLPASKYSRFVLAVLVEEPEIEEPEEIAHLKNEIKDAEEEQMNLFGTDLGPKKAMEKFGVYSKSIAEKKNRIATLEDERTSPEAFINRAIAEMFGVERLKPGIDTIKIAQYTGAIKATLGVDFLIALPESNGTIPIVKDIGGNILEHVFDIPTGKSASLTALCNDVARRVGVKKPSDGINSTSRFSADGYSIQPRLMEVE